MSGIGFLVGVVAEVPIASSLSFRPELNFIQKGSKMDSKETIAGFTTTSTAELTLNFIELPLNIVYSVPAGSGNVFFGAGPSIGYGISGKWNSTTTTTGTGIPTQITPLNGNVKFDGKDAADNDVHLKAIDFGGNIIAGYKMANGVYINVGYTMGFSNLSPAGKTSFKTNGLSFKVGYMFGGNASED